MSEEPLKGAKARAALALLTKAYRKAVGINIFDTKTGNVVHATLDVMVAVAQDRVDDLTRQYENTGIMETPDLDEATHVLWLLEDMRKLVKETGAVLG